MEDGRYFERGRSCRGFLGKRLGSLWSAAVENNKEKLFRILNGAKVAH